MTRSRLNSVVSATLPTLPNIMGRYFDLFDSVFDDGLTFNNYLPYNTVLLSDNEYRIEIAMAGYKKEDISVEIDENNILKIMFGTRNNSSNDSRKSYTDKETYAQKEENDNPLNVREYPHYLHRGITQRRYTMTFGLPRNPELVSANFADGILTVDIHSNDQTNIRKIDVT